MRVGDCRYLKYTYTRPTIAYRAQCSEVGALVCGASAFRRDARLRAVQSRLTTSPVGTRITADIAATVTSRVPSLVTVQVSPLSTSSSTVPAGAMTGIAAPSKLV